jgi:hypothetical protein
MKHGARTRVHRKQGVYCSWYKTSSACVRTTDVTVVFPLGVWGAMGCSGGGMRIVSFRLITNERGDERMRFSYTLLMVLL